MKFSIKNKSIKTLIFSLIFGILAGAICKFFIFDFIAISGESMNPTITNKEIVCINKIAYGIINPTYKNFLLQWNKPKSGDIVIFLHDNKLVVKRCALIEGDNLEIILNNHYILTSNSKSGEFSIPITREQKNWLETFKEVPEGFVFVVGDNLEQSLDSRDYGFVASKNIIGKIIGKK